MTDRTPIETALFRLDSAVYHVRAARVLLLEAAIDDDPDAAQGALSEIEAGFRDYEAALSIVMQVADDGGIE